MTGGYTGSEVTSTTEILTLKEGKVWQFVGNLPRPGYGLRATTVNNVIYLLGRNILRPRPGWPLSSGGGTEILQFDSDGSSWQVYSHITPRSGMKLEVSTLDCEIVQHYTAPPEIIDGDWGAWSDWEPCTAICGTGEQSRSRSCDSPPPSGGGDCQGDGQETRECNTHSCPTGDILHHNS